MAAKNRRSTFVWMAGHIYKAMKSHRRNWRSTTACERKRIPSTLKRLSTRRLAMKKIETKSAVLLKHHLKALKLPTFHAECEKVATRCATENVDHLGFLLQLCELELITREKRAAERRLKAARFPNNKTLEDFKFEAQPSLNRVLLGELLRGEYVDKRESVIFVGNPGT